MTEARRYEPEVLLLRQELIRYVENKSEANGVKSGALSQ